MRQTAPLDLRNVEFPYKTADPRLTTLSAYAVRSIILSAPECTSLYSLQSLFSAGDRLSLLPFLKLLFPSSPFLISDSLSVYEVFPLLSSPLFQRSRISSLFNEPDFVPLRHAQTGPALFPLLLLNLSASGTSGTACPSGAARILLFHGIISVAYISHRLQQCDRLRRNSFSRSREPESFFRCRLDTHLIHRDSQCLRHILPHFFPVRGQLRSLGDPIK